MPTRIKLIFLLVLCLLSAGSVNAVAMDGIVAFNLTGDSMIDSYGFYQTELKVGSPARAYRMLIDTGSDITWVFCDTNTTDVAKSNKYNSSSDSVLRCGDKLCGTVYPKSRKCNSPDEPCPYSVSYQDGTGTSGYYISDTVLLTLKGPNASAFESSAKLVFGCAIEITGSFQVDGLMGLGHGRGSLPSQLHIQGKAPRVFSHCLRGKSEGGGYLVLGEIEEPSKLSYTPLDSSPFYYNVEIKSIYMNGINLLISSRAFENSQERGTFVDSGTTLMSLNQEAYYPVLAAISNATTLSPYEGAYPRLRCYWGDVKSLDWRFPAITLKMKGGGLIILHPGDYLLESGLGFTCIGIDKSSSGLNILGDVVLKDKLIIYDLNNKRIGWGSYDCSVSPNVTLTYPTESSAYTGRVGADLLVLILVVALICNL